MKKDKIIVVIKRGICEGVYSTADENVVAHVLDYDAWAREDNKNFLAHYRKLDEEIVEVGQRVRVLDNWPYTGLVGHITEILDGEDKETENEGIELWCEFESPESEEEICALEKAFSEAYGHKKTMEDIILDRVCMSIENLEFLSEEKKDKQNIKVGQRVRVIDDWPYTGLVGYITEILDGECKETENEDTELWCEFDVPKSHDEIRSLEKAFTEAYGEPKTLEDIGLDRVCMSYDELEFLSEE